MHFIVCESDLERERDVAHLRFCGRAPTPHIHERAIAWILAGFYHSEEDKENEGGKRSYYRVLEVDCSQGDATDKLRDIFKKVFHNMATRVVTEGEIEEESHVAKVASNLRELPNLHWAK